MKKFRSLIALLLALLALPMCLFACTEGGKGNEEGTIDPNDTTDGLRVDINIRDLPTEEGLFQNQNAHLVPLFVVYSAHCIRKDFPEH